MKLLEKVCYLIFLLLLLACWGGTAQAISIPTAEILYMEEQIPSGSWQYDFIFDNTTDALSDPAWHMYAVTLEFSQAVDFEWISKAVGWDVIVPADNPANEINLVFTETGGAGLAPGSSLSGFSFLFNRQVGSVPFFAFFEDPATKNTNYFEGTTAPVPEPATITLFATGLIGLGLLRRKKNENRL